MEYRRGEKMEALVPFVGVNGGYDVRPLEITAVVGSGSLDGDDVDGDYAVVRGKLRAAIDSKDVGGEFGISGDVTPESLAKAIYDLLENCEGVLIRCGSAFASYGDVSGYGFDDGGSGGGSGGVAGDVSYSIVNIVPEITDEWAFTGDAAPSGYHWECQYSSEVSSWMLLSVSDVDPSQEETIYNALGTEDAAILHFDNGVDISVTAARKFAASLSDRAINVASTSNPLVLTFPGEVDGKSSDFIVKLTLEESNGEVPSVSFMAADGESSVSFDTIDGKLPDLGEAGKYLLRFTKTDEGVYFLQGTSMFGTSNSSSSAVK